MSESTIPREHDPVWIDAKRVAELVGMDRKTVYLMAERGKIPAYKPRGARIWRFRSDDIYRWIEEGYNGAPLRKGEHGTP